MTSPAMAQATISERFLAHVFAGDMDAALQLVAPDATFVATRRAFNPDNPLHGTYRGHDGIRSFFRLFLEIIEPGEFTIDGRCATVEKEVLYGRFRHIVRRTTLPFGSEWAMIAGIAAASRLSWWHFYEDSDALGRALRPATA